MSTDTHPPWLTTADLRTLFRLRDPRALRDLAVQLGGIKIGGAWRIPPEAVDRIRINPQAEADQNERPALTAIARHVRDPKRNVPTSLDPDWHH